MNTCKRLLLSGISGVCITGVGVCLAFLGHWGPCGPGDSLAAIGGLMSFYQWQVLRDIVPAVEDLNADMPSAVVTVFQFVLPVLVWFTCAFVVLTAFSYFRRRHGHVA